MSLLSSEFGERSIRRCCYNHNYSTGPRRAARIEDAYVAVQVNRSSVSAEGTVEGKEMRQVSARSNCRYAANGHSSNGNGQWSCCSGNEERLTELAMKTTIRAVAVR